MAKIKFGMMMTDARGKLGGQVFSKNRSGAYVRTKVTPVNPRTTFQQANRSLLGSISSGWSVLTSSQRGEWNNTVESWQKTNVFGDLQKPSGKNLYTSLNKVRLSIFPELGQQVSPPAKVEFPAFSILSGSYTAATGVFIITLNGESVVGRTFRIRATGIVSPGTSYFQNLLRQVGTNFVVSAGSLITISTAYPLRFGGIPTGMSVFVEVTPVAENGQLGVPATIKVTSV